MRITIEVDGVTASVESDEFTALDEALVLIAQALRGVGYHFDGMLEVADA